MLTTDKLAILRDFEAWLDAIDDDEFTGIHDRAASDDSPDLTTFYRELTALRQEIRLQSKSAARVADSVTGLAKALETDSSRQAADMTSVLQEVKGRIPEAQRAAQRPFALEYIALVEGLRRSLATVEALTIPTLLVGHQSKERFRQSLRGAHSILLGKADDVMRRLRLYPVAAVGDVFDPKRMKAVSTSADGKVSKGTVSEVCVQGYELDGYLLRTAEVKVEK